MTPLVQLKVDVLVGAVQDKTAEVPGTLLVDPVVTPQVIDWPMLPIVCT